MITVSLVDDHILLRHSLARIINNFEGYKVLFEANNGKHFIEQLEGKSNPDIVLLDISMPEMNGYETAAWIKANLPKTKILVLSMMDNDSSVIRMINNGARGYILKDSKPPVLREAFDSISQKGFYSNDLISSKMLNYVASENQQEQQKLSRAIPLSKNEITFIKLASSDKTYKEIAKEMNLSPRTVDDYRTALFEKLQIKSRIGLVIFAVKEGIVKI